MKEEVTLNRKEQKRLLVMNELERGEITGNKAADIVGMSLRHVKRLRAAYRRDGAAALAHGNRGRKPFHTLSTENRNQILILGQSIYAGCNQQHFSELLAEREGIAVCRSTVRRILLEAGIRSTRKRRPPQHRKRRDRYPQEGMLLQIDGSPHDWLEGRGPWLSLIGAIDDATGKAPHALFREQEDAQGYFLLVRHIVDACGIPLALYHDGHSIFHRSEKEPELLEEQLRGERMPTQFGRLMEELGITSITAQSPQAKGRIERLWGTLQDRLVSELRLAGASTIEEANRVLRAFLPRFNQRFAVSAAQSGVAYRTPLKGFNPDEVFCFKYLRTVGADNVVRFGEYRLQILPCHGRLSYARAKVEVHERMEGSLAVYYQGQCLMVQPAPSEAPVLRTRPMPRVMPAISPSLEPVGTTVMAKKRGESQSRYRLKPAPDHPWRRPFKVHIDRG